MELEIPSGTARLAAYVANPPVADSSPPTLVLCHGYPSSALGAADTPRSYPELAARIATEGWRAVTFAFRGCGGSTGDFSLEGWLHDVLSVVDHLLSMGDTRGVWLAGFGTGGALCIAGAARRPEVCGVAALGAPADFKDWASHPRRLLQHAREIGAIHQRDFPPSTDSWARGLHEIKPTDDAAADACDRMLDQLRWWAAANFLW